MKVVQQISVVKCKCHPRLLDYKVSQGKMPVILEKEWIILDKDKTVMDEGIKFRV